MELRWYQKEAVDAALMRIRDGINSVVVLPTGSGKTPTLTSIIEDFLTEHPTLKVLCLSHVDRILIQNYNTIENMLGEIVGLYSAGLGEKNANKMVTVAGIQSVYKKPELFKKVGLIIIDECHLVNHENRGMYRDFITALETILDCSMPVLGLTATPYRTSHGFIHEGNDTLFTEIAYNGGSMHRYNRLVEEGFLAKMFTRQTDMELSVEGIKVTAGDFNAKELSENLNRMEITESAVLEVIKYGKKYDKWLFFAIDIEHAENIKACLLKHKISACCIHSKMEEDKDIELALFKKGFYRAVVNVDILTTGFDEPGIDLIAMMRPTMSPIIHVQTAGRGARPADGKDHCLFLDFAGNTKRLGPINDIQLPSKKKGKGTGNPITKTCPECSCIAHPTVKICEACGHEFVFKQKLQSQSGTAPIVKGGPQEPTQKAQWAQVTDVTYSIHQKVGATNSLRVMYRCGMNAFSEWIAYGRPNFAGNMAKNWVKWRWQAGVPLPKDVHDLFKQSHLLRKPTEIFVDVSGKWPVIKDSKF